VSGIVYLVGAGPGDPGLVSRRALELVRNAEVLVFDRLAAPALVAEAPPGCDVIDAGKVAGDHTLTQDETNALIVERARAGRRVVRLKGGDPFLFGRGGVEAIACRQAGVAFEVVPGVTSAFAVAAYAGIPVTHRGIAHHVTVITASAGADGKGDPDYEWLAKSDGTLVFLMGLRRIAHIAAQLVLHGAPYDRPVAVISRGTTSEQRTVVGDLGSIADLVAEARLASPAIVVVGDVVTVREQVEWFERRPLFGRNVTVTRARAQSSELVAALRALGANVIECPTIRVVEADPAPLDAAIADMQRFRYLLLTSRNGADSFFDRLDAAGLDARALHGVRVCAVGSGTAEACAEAGIAVDVVPPRGKRTSAGLLEVLGEEPLWGEHVLLVQGEQADTRLPEGLRAAGSQVEVVHAYATEMEVPDAPTLLGALRSDLVTFTSASTVQNLARLVPEELTPPKAVTIGPVTTTAAREHGFEVVGEASDPSIGGLVVEVLKALADG
jgi:uroporphyrinogen III methyltransferase/synthase